MSIFGDLERAFAHLYPYRWAFAAGIIVSLAVLTGYAYRQGWHSILWRHSVKASMIATPALVVTLWLGWFLGSPLFTNTTVDEAFPFAVYATMPHYIGIEDVEAAMAGMAKVESPVSEEMPDMVKASPVQSGGAAASPTPENPVDGATTAPGSNETSIQLGPVILKSGEFQDAGSFHKGTGVATIYMGADGTRLLRFEGFKVTNGPDLHVVLSPYGGPDEKGAKCRKADLEKMQTLHDQYGIV